MFDVLDVLFGVLGVLFGVFGVLVGVLAVFFGVLNAYLIFVTDTRTVSVEKKSFMWRNFTFLYMTDVEKSKISPHVD